MTLSLDKERCKEILSSIEAEMKSVTDIFDRYNYYYSHEPNKDTGTRVRFVNETDMEVMAARIARNAIVNPSESRYRRIRASVIGSSELVNTNLRLLKEHCDRIEEGREYGV